MFSLGYMSAQVNPESRQGAALKAAVEDQIVRWKPHHRSDMFAAPHAVLLAIAIKNLPMLNSVGHGCLACMMIMRMANLFVCGAAREGLVGVGIAGGVVAAIGAVVLAAVFGGRRR